MEFIKEIEPRLNKNGHSKKWAIFKCPFCLQEVERRLENGKRQKSCGCKGIELSVKARTGKKLTEQHKEKIRLANTGKKRTEEYKQGLSIKYTGKNNPNYGNGDKIRGENNFWYGKGFLLSGENNPNYGNGDKIKGEKNPMYGRKGVLSPMYGKIGSLCPNWNNGSSFEPYSPEFNKPLKQSILERDNYTCQNPNCEELHDKLHIHHIDYNKKNNNSENLIVLGDSCHSKTSGKNNRQYWTEFYQNIMMNKLMECLL